VIRQGRFWAEEGNVFFYNASRLSWNEAIFNSYAGYTNLAANLAGMGAFYLAPLRVAPYVSTLFAATVQTLPAALFAISSDSWIKTWHTLIVACLVVLVQPASQEIWLSSLGSQSFLNLSVGIILLLGCEQNLSKRLFQYFILSFAALSGPGASFLLPFFFARSYLERSYARLWQALALGLGSAAQLLLFYHKSDRALTVDMPLFLNAMYLKHFLVPFVGRIQSYEIAAQISSQYKNGTPYWWVPIFFIAYVAFLLLLIWRTKAYTAFWPLASALTMTFLAFFGALGDRTGLLEVDGGNRYTYASQVLMELALLIVVRTGLPSWERSLTKWLLIWLVIIGAHEYFWSNPMFAQGPSWRAEVRRWQVDHNHPLELWPKGWQLHLNSKP
jgi:hypothetical protein